MSCYSFLCFLDFQQCCNQRLSADTFSQVNSHVGKFINFLLLIILNNFNFSSVNEMAIVHYSSAKKVFDHCSLASEATMIFLTIYIIIIRRPTCPLSPLFSFISYSYQIDMVISVLYVC